MPVKQYKPTSPGRRGMSVSTFEEITKKRPEKALTEPLKKTAGRNSYGRITTRHQGGGHKRMYRVIDWRRNKIGVQARVIAIEYDPNRSARMALLEYADGERRYILAPNGLKVGTRLSSGPEADLSPGNALALRDIPVGSVMHNLELKPGRGGQIVRGAGVGAQLMAKEGDPGRRCACPRVRCGASTSTAWPRSARLGTPSTPRSALGKAGRSRHMGIRPTVRGVGDEPARPSARRW